MKKKNLVTLTLTACQKLCGGVCLGTIGNFIQQVKDDQTDCFTQVDLALITI